MALPTVETRPVRHQARGALATQMPLKTGGEYTSRSLLVRELASQFTRDRAPRLQLLVIVSLAGAAAFLASVVMLWQGGTLFEKMALRYAIAALVGYIAFVALMRLWIAVHRPSHGADVDPMDVAKDVVDVVLEPSGTTRLRCADGVEVERDVPLEMESRQGVSDPDSWFAGRRAASNARDTGDGWSVDLDDLTWLVMAAVAAVGGAVAIVYVIYIAPVLLAEVALDAAIISALYRRLRRDETGHWLTTVLTRTWVPALAVVAFAMLGGYALQAIVPEAQSIGGVIRAFSD